MKEALAFDDVLLVPQYSQIKSRDDIDISTTICSHRLDVPIIAANMSAITETEMLIAMGNLGAMGVLHRFDTIENRLSMIQEARSQTKGVIGYALGLNEFDESELFASLGGDIAFLDVAHADQEQVIDYAEKWYDEINLPLVVGNYATGDAVANITLFAKNNFAVKIGIGSGSVCTTRVMTGHGLPTFASLLDCKGLATLIADGGIKNSGDIVKALAAGASAVMIGRLFAGTPESATKTYYGSASERQKGGRRYVEGVEADIRLQGPVRDVIKDLVDGIKSGLSYSGAKNIKELQKNAEFVKVTTNGVRESYPHFS